MPAAWVDDNGNGGSGPLVTSLVVNAPASIVAGNLLVATLGAGTGTTGTFSSTGWTLQGHSATNGIALFTKVATGSEPANYTFSYTGAGGFLAGWIGQYSGVSGVDAFAFTEANGVMTATVPSVTATVANDLWVAIVYEGGAGNTPSTPAGFTVRGAYPTVGHQGDFGFDKAITATGATGTATVTFGSTSYPAIVSVLLTPTVSAVTGTATLTLGPLTLTATGAVTITGTATIALGPLTLTATGTSTAASNITLGPLTLTATAIVAALPTPALVTTTNTPLTTVTLQDQQ